MRSKYIVNGTGKFLSWVMCRVEKIATWNTLVARLLALPIGIALTIALPLIRFASFCEAWIFCVLNILGACFVEQCSFSNAYYWLKQIGREGMGVIIVPFMAIFVGASMFFSLAIAPVNASRRFHVTCQQRRT